MEWLVKFKFRAFWVRPTLLCEKCKDFDTRSCPVMVDLLNNGDALVFGGTHQRFGASAFLVDMDDMLDAWQTYKKCKNIAANCQHAKTK